MGPWIAGRTPPGRTCHPPWERISHYYARIACMKKKITRYAHEAELRAEFEQRKDAIRHRLTDFLAIQPDEYFYELLYCLLTPQSSAVNAHKAVEALRKADIRNNGTLTETLLHQKTYYIRFHKTKAKHINAMKEQFPEIATMLCAGLPDADLRQWLVLNVYGVGWKEASHFLRNIGHRNLAILDRHILKNLRRHGVIRAMPKTLTPKRYLSIEKKMAHFAQQVGITVDELDLLFWSRETGEILK
jgi:N-glycosylase/DNA lyase